MKTTKVKLTVEELNNAYNHINSESKVEKINKKFPTIYTASDSSYDLEFKFFPDMGSKGAWICTTDVEVLDKE